MIRFLGAAGLAAYALAVSIAFPSVQEAAASLSFFAPAVAAETGPAEAGTAPADAPVGTSAPVVTANSTWAADRDGMLMQQGTDTEPFAVLGAL